MARLIEMVLKPSAPGRPSPTGNHREWPWTLVCWFAIGLALIARQAEAVTVDFDDSSLVSLMGGDTHWNNPTHAGTVVAGPHGPNVLSTFQSRGATFLNVYDQTYQSWGGFAYSKETDTTQAGFGNPFSAYATTGLRPDAGNFGVATGYLDTAPNDVQPFAFDPHNPDHLAQLPNFALPSGYTIASMLVTNTTYAALSMRDGDGYGKKFGGEDGSDPDFFKLTAYGTNALDALLPNTATFYLADYRFDDPLLDTIVNDWVTWDLSSLAGATHLYFNLASTDIGQYGMNTPAFFAVDNIQLVPIPEPSSFVLLAIAGATAMFFKRRRRRST